MSGLRLCTHCLDLPSLCQHHGKEGADELHFAYPLPLHGTMLLSEIRFSGLRVSALAV